MKVKLRGDGPRQLMKITSRGWYGFRCTDCRFEKWWLHRDEAEEMFENHDCRLERSPN